MKVSQYDIGWLAGIIDGEGSITICKRGPTFVPHIAMENTSKLLVDKFCEILDGLDISYCVSGRQKDGNRKYQWKVEISGRPRVYKMIMSIQDFLVSKRKQAAKVLEWIEMRGIDLRGKYTDKQLTLITQIRELNGRGRAYSENPEDERNREQFKVA